MDGKKDLEFMRIGKNTKVRLILPEGNHSYYVHWRRSKFGEFKVHRKSKNKCPICRYNRKQKRIKLIKRVLSKLIFWSNK